MKLPFFASFIVFCLFLRIYLKKSNKQADSRSESFWEREAKANSTRRKSLDNLDYITIPKEFLSWNSANFVGLNDNYRFGDALQTINHLSTRKIVNLTGLTNTDLKLEYGTANITALTEYDQNYTVMVRTLQKWADILLEEGYADAAETLMEFAVSTRTDISRTYYKLAELYACRLETERVRALIATAETLSSLNRDTIVRTLQESYL